jgi:hypothetical protein
MGPASVRENALRCERTQAETLDDDGDGGGGGGGDHAASSAAKTLLCKFHY